MQINLKSFSIKIAEYLYKRLSKHFQTLKYIKKSSKTKAKWIEEAFLEKLESEKDFSFDDIPVEKYIHFKMNQELYNKVEERVNLIKRFRNFSKKQWMVEAIYEKLKRQ